MRDEETSEDEQLFLRVMGVFRSEKLLVFLLLKKTKQRTENKPGRTKLLLMKYILIMYAMNILIV